ncbi:hypothetical protein MNBD_DELTA01-958 [hydrothermal vent metagenome]|uniref:Sulfate transporter, CysZ-type n=1 Tax=hydrothermal vent metagenome TaxID=652676 RepID=A0A3B0QPS2_9ZZZZ
MTNFFRGIGDFFVGCKMVATTRELWPYVWIPLLINIVVYAIVVGVGIYFYGDLMAYFMPTGEAWYVAIFRFFAWIIFTVVIGLGIFFTFFVVASTIASPFNERLSAKYEELITGRHVSEGFGVTAVITQEIKRLIVYVIIFGLLLFLTSIISFIPFVNFLVPVLWLLFAVYVAAFEFISYVLDRRGLLLGEKSSYLRSRLLRCGGFGLATAWGMLIPVVNVAVIPCAVVGATHLAIKSGVPQGRAGKDSRSIRGPGKDPGRAPEFDNLLEESSGDEVK